MSFLSQAQKTMQRNEKKIPGTTNSFEHLIFEQIDNNFGLFDQKQIDVDSKTSLTVADVGGVRAPTGRDGCKLRCNNFPSFLVVRNGQKLLAHWSGRLGGGVSLVGCVLKLARKCQSRVTL